MSVALTVVGVAALEAVRLQRRTADCTNDERITRLYAQSAIEIAFLMIYEDTGWRTTLGSGTWVSNRAIGDGTFSVSVQIIDDGDGNIANDDAIITGTGRLHDATHVITVTVTPDGPGMAIVPKSWQRSAA